MKVLHVFNNVFAMPDEGSGEKTHNHFMSQAFTKIDSQMVSFEPAGYSQKSDQSIKAKRGAYRKLKKFVPKLITDWLRDLYCVVYDFKFDKKIIDVIKREKPDFIFERITSYHDSGLRAARKMGLPFVVEIHEMHNSLSYKERVNFELYRRYIWIKVAREADLVVVVSSMLKQYLVDEGVQEKNIIVLPNAVDLDLFKPMNRRDIIRHELSIQSEVVLGFVGCMHPYHGIDLLPEVCKQLINTGLKFKILLVGSFDRWPGGEEAYRKVLSDNGVEEFFILVGGVPVTSVPEYIEAMDIGLMPDSNEYGSPLKIFEYGAMSKPVVVPEYGPVKDVIEHDVNGLLFLPKSLPDFVQKITLLVKSEELATRLGNKLYQDVVDKHTWSINASAIVDRVASLK